MKFKRQGGSEQEPGLSVIERAKLLRGTMNTEYFRAKVRPMLYSKCGNDPEAVNGIVLKELARNSGKVRLLSPLFTQPKNLIVNINGIDLLPLGTAAGLDKNGEVLAALDHIFGFQEPGTVVIEPREGNPRVRMAALDKDMDLLNAQGFSSKGLGNFLNNISEYRKKGGNGVVYVSICGMPSHDSYTVDKAIDEVGFIIRQLKEYADGFIWNPFSPNTESLKMLRTPGTFRKTGKIMLEFASDKLLLVKIGPYEERNKANVLNLIDSFIDGGGQGVVTANTQQLSSKELPDPIRQEWGYGSAGRSGRFLTGHMLRSIRDIRRNLPESIIFGTGGITDGNTAFEAFHAGADALEGYTPYVYFGAGLVRKIMRELEERLSAEGLGSLKELQRAAR